MVVLSNWLGKPQVLEGMGPPSQAAGSTRSESGCRIDSEPCLWGPGPGPGRGRLPGGRGIRHDRWAPWPGAHMSPTTASPIMISRSSAPPGPATGRARPTTSHGTPAARGNSLTVTVSSLRHAESPGPLSTTVESCYFTAKSSESRSL